VVLAGDALELMIAPGDVLVVRGNGRLAEIGNVGGFMGHVLVVVAGPCNVPLHSPASAELQPVWPQRTDITDLWRVRTVESTRRESGLYEADMVFYIDPVSRQLKLVGEVNLQGDLGLSDNEAVELWQSPGELRGDLRLDLMAEVLAEMRERQGNWSAATAARAVLKMAAVTWRRGASAETLEEIQACWERAPICTSVVIGFWQRYLAKLAAPHVGPGGALYMPGERVQYWSECYQEWLNATVAGQNVDAYGAVLSYNLDVKFGAQASNIRRIMETETEVSAKALDLILKYMPLKADRALPGDLLRNLRDCGWVPVMQVPQIFRPAILQPASYCTPMPPPVPVPGPGLSATWPQAGSAPDDLSLAAAGGQPPLESEEDKTLLQEQRPEPEADGLAGLLLSPSSPLPVEDAQPRLLKSV
jgi:hypothetical protein